MSLLLTFVLAASPSACGETFPAVWKAWLAREAVAETPPRFAKVPDAQQRVLEAWLKECSSLDGPALECARGVQLQKEIAAQFEAAKGGKMPKEELEHAAFKQRRAWSPLSCPTVEKAISRAADAVVPPPAKPNVGSRKSEEELERAPKPRSPAVPD